MERLCSRCRQEPAVPGQRWGQQCRRESKRRHAAQITVQRVEQVKAAVPAVVVPRPERVVPAGGSWPLTPPGACANCLRIGPAIQLRWTPAGIPLCGDCLENVWPANVPFPGERGNATAENGNAGSAGER